MTKEHMRKDGFYYVSPPRHECSLQVCDDDENDNDNDIKGEAGSDLNVKHGSNLGAGERNVIWIETRDKVGGLVATKHMRIKRGVWANVYHCQS